MEKRIDLERRGKEPAQVIELNLDNCRSTSIDGLTEAYTSLDNLSMINMGLVNLKGFPKLPKLTRLELSDNRISSGLDVLQGCPNLSHLNVSGNKIKDLDALQPLKTLENLTHLDLFNNPLGSEEEDYRNKVFKLLPNLKYLDGTDIDNVEDEDSDAEDGHNGVEEGDEEEDDDEEGEEEEDSEEEGPGLSAIYNDNLGDEEDGEDFEAEEEEDADDEDIEEEEEPEEPRGKRRKTETEEDEDGDDA